MLGSLLKSLLPVLHTLQISSARLEMRPTVSTFQQVSFLMTHDQKYNILSKLMRINITRFPIPSQRQPTMHCTCWHGQSKQGEPPAMVFNKPWLRVRISPALNMALSNLVLTGV